MLLVLHSDEEALLSIGRTLYSAGILTIRGSYRYALTNPREDKVKAVMIPDPYDTGKPPHFLASFRSRFPHIPLIAFYSPYRDMPEDLRYADACINGTLPPAELVENLLVALYEVTGDDYALLHAGNLRDHLLSDTLTYRQIPLALTPIERAILRYLMYRHPEEVSPRELLRYCTKPGTEPTLCNIPSHIYRINLKAEEAIGHHIIKRADTNGYCLLLDIPAYV